MQLKQTNQRLWLLIGAVLAVVVISAIAIRLLRQKREHRAQMKQADAKLSALVQKLHQTKAEKEMMSQKIEDIMSNKENRQELEALTPSVLQKSGESKFRQRFELLYPKFLPGLHERRVVAVRGDVDNLLGRNTHQVNGCGYDELLFHPTVFSTSKDTNHWSHHQTLSPPMYKITL